MKSLATLTNLATTLSQNITAANQALLIQLMSDQQRYSIEKYFDNERQFVSYTVGAMTLATTANLAGGATSATLTGTWNYNTGTQNVTFANAGGTTVTLTANAASGAVSGTLSSNWTLPTGLQSVTFGNSNNDVRDVQFTNGSMAITWTVPLTGATTSTTLTTNATSQTISVQFVNNSTALTWIVPLRYSMIGTTITTQGFQRYKIPAGISKITNSTIYVGQLRFVPAPVQTRNDWDRLNFLPYTADFPNYYFIYNGYVEFWPIPSTTGNTIAFNYKSRIPDFSTAFLFSDTSGTAYVAGQTVFDYQAGSLSGITAGSVSITGSSTSWNTTGKFPLNTDITPYNLYLNIAAPNGDGLWYPIYQFNSDTSLTLASPIMTAPSSTTAAHGYSIAQLPVLSEDFHDMLVHGALKTYFSSIVPNEGKFKQFDEMYQSRLQLLSEYAGQKQVNYDLGEDVQLLNPNLFPFFPNGVNN